VQIPSGLLDFLDAGSKAGFTVLGYSKLLFYSFNSFIRIYFVYKNLFKKEYEEFWEWVR